MAKEQQHDDTQAQNSALMLLARQELYTRFTPEELIQAGIYYIPPGIDVRFVPAASMFLFEGLTEGRVKFIKLHNWDRPAASVRFNTKHKYATYRNVDKAEVHRMLVGALARAEGGYRKVTEALDLRLQDQQVQYAEAKEAWEGKKIRLEAYLENMDAYEFTISNYFKHYTYYQVTIKYVERGQVGYLEQHLAKTKTNIIFISEALTHKHREHQHKQIEKYLNSLEHVITGNTTDLFAKKKGE